MKSPQAEIYAVLRYVEEPQFSLTKTEVNKAYNFAANNFKSCDEILDNNIKLAEVLQPPIKQNVVRNVLYLYHKEGRSVNPKVYQRTDF